MTDLSWPTGVPGPQISSMSRTEVVGFKESDLASGPSFVEAFSDDTPQFHSVSYIFTRGEARLFQLWLRENKVKVFSPWFVGPLSTEDSNIKTQTCRFTSDGYPQLTGQTLSGLHSYSATLLTRAIENGDDAYSEVVKSAANATDGNIDLTASALDKGLNG